MPAEVKAYWKEQADEERRRHQEKYPDYKYTARRSSTGIDGEEDLADGEEDEESNLAI